MTNPTSQYPGAPWPPAAPPQRPGLWTRLSPLQRVGAIAVALLLPCCGGLTVIGAFADDPKTKPLTGAAPAAEQLAGGTEPAGQAPAGEAPAGDLPEGSAPEGDAPTGQAATEDAPAEEQPTEESAEQDAAAEPTVTKQTVTERKKIAFSTRTVKDATLPDGETRVRTKGVAGVKTLTYEVTRTDGAETSRKLVRTEITKKPVTKVIAVGTKTATSDCRSGYSPCVPIASDVDCAGGGGNGPEYVDGPIRVTGSDPYDLDRDGDGIACD